MTENCTGADAPNLQCVKGVRVDLLLVVGIVLAIWAQLVLKLRIDWTTDAQYEFGPFVPLFIVYLTVLRWKDRPAPEPSRTATILAVFAGLLVFLLPFRLVQEANPDWRPLNWIHATVVTALSLLLAAYYGGWRWVAHFAPPLLLIFFALPWPLKAEQTVIQSMARAVAAITTEILNLAGVPALQDGNVIRVPTGPVGIQDACTGVRSLAGTLMASIFFGEFYRLFWVKRVLLVGAGVLVAFLLNLVRTFTLGWVAASRGLEAIATWHDQTGFLIFCVAFAILWLMGSLLAGPLRQMPASAAPTELLRPVRLSVLIGTAIWLLLIAMSTEGWYQMKERNLARLRTWDVQLAETNRSLSFAEVPDEARAILRYSEGHSALFEEAGYPLWQIHFFRWAPGRSSSQLAVLHRPEICLPAAGLKFISGTRKAAIQFENVTIPFECSTFDSEGTPLYVFRTLCEDRRPLGSSSGFDQSISGRLHSAWEGRRNLGQKLLQIDISGASTEQAALADLQARLPQFLAVSK